MLLTCRSVRLKYVAPQSCSKPASTLAGKLHRCRRAWADELAAVAGSWPEACLEMQRAGWACKARQMVVDQAGLQPWESMLCKL